MASSLNQTKVRFVVVASGNGAAVRRSFFGCRADCIGLSTGMRRAHIASRVEIKGIDASQRMNRITVRAKILLDAEHP